MNPEELLRDTPYLIDGDEESVAAFAKVVADSSADRERAARENERIRREATALIGPYLAAMRTELVAESNEIEGYHWTPGEVRAVIQRDSAQSLLDGPTRNLIDSVRADPRVYEVLGLYKAHLLADDWNSREAPPTGYEIRGLHQLILGNKAEGGRYKRQNNAIGGSTTRTAHFRDVDRQMVQLTDWWRASSADPLLNATVVHAWLANIHPFEDGNGRTARVLANLELARAGYPPLIVRAGSDRGQYYAALAESDEGNILPLYSLFATLLRRQVKALRKPGYVDALVNDRLLSTNVQRFDFWQAALDAFERQIRSRADEHGLEVGAHGRLRPEDYDSLAELDPSGNGWYLSLGRPGTEHEWLLWFGFRSQEMRDLDPSEFHHPSLWISRRDRRVGAPHPYVPVKTKPGHVDDVPHEIALLPGRARPVCARIGWQEESFDLERGAKHVVDRLEAQTPLA